MMVGMVTCEGFEVRRTDMTTVKARSRHSPAATARPRKEDAGPVEATKRSRRRERIEITSLEQMDALLPKQWVALEVAEVTINVGMTKAFVIAHGRDEKRVMASLEGFMKEHPGQKVGIFYAGPRLKRGQAVIVV